MQITLKIPDNFAKLPTNIQAYIKKGMEARLQTEFEMHELEELKRKKIYSPKNESILQESIKMAKEDIAKGVTREEAFQQLKKVIGDIGEELNKNSQYQEFMKEVETKEKQHN